MARDIDEKKKRKALRKLRKAAERADAENGPGLSDWEREFVDEVEMRVEKYGSAFGDPEKGDLDEPLSALQTRKLKEIDKKSRGKDTGFKARSGFSKSKKKHSFTPRSRDIHEDVDQPPVPTQKETANTLGTDDPAKLRAKLKLVPASQLAQPKATKEKIMDTQDTAPTQPKKPRSPFQIIEGGKSK